MHAVEIQAVDAVADRIEYRLVGGLELAVALGQFGAQAGDGQVGLDPRDDLFGLKRLGDVIDRAERQALDLVVGVVERRQEDHRDIAGLRARP